ncbi:hypothetical protein LCGC14_2976310 [marine sediment metagenome]|uniref:Uncharacterized protein n=1 Tax=marine sediment metagenome TaxID=412755 RepID=A0A0F8XVB4_9ZZZZ
MVFTEPGAVNPWLLAASVAKQVWTDVAHIGMLQSFVLLKKERRFVTTPAVWALVFVFHYPLPCVGLILTYPYI